MQVIPSQGSRVELSAIDADGLPIAVPTPANWALTGGFNLFPAPDGLSATVIPKGNTTTGTLVVSAGGLTVTADLSYTSTVPIERVATKLNLTFTALPVEEPPPPPINGDGNIATEPPVGS